MNGRITRHALVCGASMGIGEAAARALAGEGRELTLLARNEEALKRLAEELRTSGSPRVHVLVADLDAR